MEQIRQWLLPKLLVGTWGGGRKSATPLDFSKAAAVKKPNKHKHGEPTGAARMGISQQAGTLNIAIPQSCVTPGRWKKAKLGAPSQPQVLFGVCKVNSREDS